MRLVTSDGGGGGGLEFDDEPFPIEDYDDLRVGEVLPLLPQLYADELDLVAARERAGADRAAVLDRIAELLEGDEPTMAVDVLDDGPAPAPVKKSAPKKVAAGKTRGEADRNKGDHRSQDPGEEDRGREDRHGHEDRGQEGSRQEVGGHEGSGEEGHHQDCCAEEDGGGEEGAREEGGALGQTFWTSNLVVLGDLDAHRERLRRNPRAEFLDEIARVGRHPQPDPVLDRRTRVLAGIVHKVDEVVHATLPHQRVVECRVERNRHAVPGRDGPSRLPGAFYEHLVRAELVVADAESSARKLLELAGVEQGAHLSELGAEAGAEHGQVRPHLQVGGVDCAEHDLLHVQLVGDELRVRASGVRSFDDDAQQRLTVADAARPSAPGGRARRLAVSPTSARAAQRPVARAPANPPGRSSPVHPDTRRQPGFATDAR